ncbi:MAG: hypothetical protein AB7D36_05625, partial [Oscillospiraceae bacterium]
MNLLWHASFDPVVQLTPRIPESRSPWEDATTPRICFSENIEKALTAMPKGGNALRGMLKCREKVTPLLYAFCCDADEFPDAFIPPETVR